MSTLAPLNCPAAVQEFLDSVPYSTDFKYRSPADVMADRRAHCFDGATFAAAALRRLGHRPLVIDLKAVRDDDHVVAVFRVDGHFGAVSKSNCAGLRFREPVYRNVRELVMSYFELYFNVESEKTLRAYSLPIDLATYDHLNWTHDAAALEIFADVLTKARHYSLLTKPMAQRLARVDPRTYAAGMYGADEAGLFRP